jgi:RimJ/RimL family protein N-acetyltransferase
MGRDAAGRSHEGTLETERLVLRPWREQDAGSLYRFAEDPEIKAVEGLGHASRTVQDSLRAIREVLMADESYAITIKGGYPHDEAVGAIALRHDLAGIEFGEDEVSIGYWLARPFWGKGYVPEAARELIRHAFEDLRAKAVWAGVFDGNERSERVLKKLGMRRQRDVVQARGELARADEEAKEMHLSRLTREQWEAARSADPTTSSYVAGQQAEAATLLHRLPYVAYVRSGGQTGADRGGLDAAREEGVPICGWCPPGGLAEDLPEPPGVMALYPELKEGSADGYVERTALNVRDAHATLIVSPGGLEPNSGTEMTERFARQMGRPCLVVEGIEDADDAWRWLQRVGRGITLNVAGPRESKLPGIHDLTRDVVAELLRRDRSLQQAWERIDWSKA